jgi:hypothetical protein
MYAKPLTRNNTHITTIILVLFIYINKNILEKLEKKEGLKGNLGFL